MSEQDEKSVNNEKDIILDDVAPKKRRWKLHAVLVIFLGFGTWMFWAYAPVAQQYKASIYGGREVFLPEEITSLHIQAPPRLIDESLTSMPLFEENAVLPEVQIDVLQPIATTDKPEQTLPESENSAVVALAVQALQAQVHSMNQLMVTMQNQQVLQMQMQVRVQLFQFLMSASSTHSSINTMAEAWKSISLLPMLTDDKRDGALQTFEALTALQQEKYVLLDALHQLLSTLNQQQPKAEPEALPREQILADSAETSLTNDDTLGWLFKQFRFTKVLRNENTMSKAQQTMATDERQLITSLKRSQQHLSREQWAMLPDIDVLVHQLNQRGMETSFSAEAIASVQQGKQAWQAQAQAWMEQL